MFYALGLSLLGDSNRWLPPNYRASVTTIEAKFVHGVLKSSADRAFINKVVSPVFVVCAAKEMSGRDNAVTFPIAAAVPALHSGHDNNISFQRGQGKCLCSFILFWSCYDYPNTLLSNFRRCLMPTPLKVDAE